MSGTLFDETKTLLWRLALENPAAVKKLLKETEGILPVSVTEAKDTLLSVVAGPFSLEASSKALAVFAKVGTDTSRTISGPAFSRLFDRLFEKDGLLWLRFLKEQFVWPLQCRQEHFEKLLDRLSGAPCPDDVLVLPQVIAHWAENDASSLTYCTSRHPEIFDAVLSLTETAPDDSISEAAWEALAAMARNGIPSPDRDFAEPSKDALDREQNAEPPFPSFWQRAAFIRVKDGKVGVAKRAALISMVKARWANKGVAKLHRLHVPEICPGLLALSLDAEEHGWMDEASSASAIEMYSMNSDACLAEDRMGRSVLAVLNDLLWKDNLESKSYEIIESLMLSFVRHGTNPLLISPKASKIAASPALASLARQAEKSIR